MIQNTDQITAPNNQPSRLQQLEQRLTADDIRVLQETRAEVEQFVRLGQKWHFFARHEDASAEAGREILRNVFMPEASLAVLVDQDNGTLEQTMDDAVAQDPKALPNRLLDTVASLKPQASELIQVARNQLDVTFDAADPVACVEVKPPTKSWPEWFQVIRKHELAPTDISALYATFDSGKWHGQDPDIARQMSKTHNRVDDMGIE